MFRRQHHNDILAALRALDGDLLLEAECYFGGGTAIVLHLDEYRESVDIDFLCASQAGYRKLRQALWGKPDLSGLLRPQSGIKALRDVRVDQYGIRTWIGAGETAIKFEIVREARIALAGHMDAQLGVPVLSRGCMYAEKLLANADRWNDTSVLNRDLIDLSMMIARWGPIPDDAWRIAAEAYGDSARMAYAEAVRRVRNPDWLAQCMAGMAMDPALRDEILTQHGGPLPPEL